MNEVYPIPAVGNISFSVKTGSFIPMSDDEIDMFFVELKQFLQDKNMHLTEMENHYNIFVCSNCKHPWQPLMEGTTGKWFCAGCSKETLVRDL